MNQNIGYVIDSAQKSEILFYYAVAHQKLGKKAEAHSIFKEALSVGKGSMSDWLENQIQTAIKNSQ